LPWASRIVAWPSGPWAGLPSAQDFEHRRRLTDVHIHLVDLLDARHRRRIRCPPGAFGHHLLADTSRDRGADGGEAQVQLLARLRCAGLGDVGGSLVALGHRVVVELTAHRVGLDQGFEAFDLQPGALQCRHARLRAASELSTSALKGPG
jgi:hypothetical protein